MKRKKSDGPLPKPKPKHLQYAEARILDREWALLEPVFRQRRARGGRPTDDRRRLEGILYIAWSRRSWRRLPDRFGKPNSLAKTFARWCNDGTIDKLLKRFPPSGLSYENANNSLLTVGARIEALADLRRRLRRKRKPSIS